MTGQGVGARILRKEDDRLMRGRGQFVADLRFASMKDVAFVRSPLAHGRIRDIAVPEAQKRAVFTSVDLDGVHPIRAISGLRGFKVSDQPSLAADKVRYVGELVAMCVAPSRAEAEDIAGVVRLDLEELPAVYDMLAAREPASALLHEHWGDNIFLETFIDVNIEKALDAPIKVTREIRTARQCMAPMEGRAVVAIWDSRLEQLTLYSACQMPHIVRTGLAGCLGLEEGQVRVVAPDVGGGFGYKGILLAEEVCLGWLAMHCGHPVRWIEDRREHLTAGANCREHYYRITGYADRNGHLLGIDCEATVDSGAYSAYPFSACLEAAQVASILPGPYDFPAYRCRTYSVATNNISVIISAFNALTLSPALCALLLKPGKTHGPLGDFFAWFNRVFDRASKGYVGMCGTLIRKSVFSLAFLAALTLLSVLLGKGLPSGFLPGEDVGYFYVNVALPQAASLQRTEEAMKKVEEVLDKTPGIEHYQTIAGLSLMSIAQNTYSGFAFVTLKEWSKRKRPEEKYEAIMAHLRKELSNLPEGTTFVFPPPPIQGIGLAGGAQVVLQDRAGRDIGFLSENVNKFIEAARKRPELESVITTFLPSVPQLFVNVDRDKVIKQGIDLRQVYQTLQTFMGGYFVNYFNRFGRQWQVYVQAEGAYRTKAENIRHFFVNNDRGDPVPLSAVTSVESRPGPEFTMRYNLYRSAQINAAGKRGYSSGQVMNALEEVFKQTMPSDIGLDYIGMSFQEKKAREGIPPAAIFGFSLFCVFLILAALYESWSLPLSVLLGTPVAIFGAFLAIWVRGLENNVYAQIALIVLIGLAAKNAILIVEFAKTRHEQGKGLVEAALEGAQLRLRPILMTSFAFLLGVLPLAISTGAGGNAHQTMGTAVMGGTAAASVIAIFLIPVTFYVVGKMAGGRGKKGSAAGGPIPTGDKEEDHV